MKIKNVYIVLVLLVWFINPSFSQTVQKVSLDNPKSLDLEKDWEFSLMTVLVYLTHLLFRIKEQLIQFSILIP